jgi:hypothetical protein
MPAIVFLMRGGLFGVVLRAEPVPRAAAPEPLLGELSSRVSASGSAAARQSTLRPTAPRAGDRDRLDWSSGGTAFGAQGISTDAANALTDAAITVPNSLGGCPRQRNICRVL